MAYILGWLSNGVATFSDTFSSAQNPISSPWTKTSTVNQNVVVTGGIATNNALNSNNDDAYAWVSTGAFSAPSDNYEIVGTVAEVSINQMEIELLLRVTDTSSTYFAYEVLVNTSGGAQLVTITGGFGGNYLLWDGNNGTTNTNVTISGWTGAGDKIRARVTGTNPVLVTAWHAPAATPNTWTQLFTVSDSLASRRQTGQPGIGFYAANVGAPGSHGWTDFTVTAV